MEALTAGWEGGKYYTLGEGTKTKEISPRNMKDIVKNKRMEARKEKRQGPHDVQSTFDIPWGREEKEASIFRLWKKKNFTNIKVHRALERYGKVDKTRENEIWNMENMKIYNTFIM
jgi:hypothetical protein